MRNLLAMIKASLATQSANAGNFANISNMDSKSEESRLLVQARENPKTPKTRGKHGQLIFLPNDCSRRLIYVLLSILHLCQLCWEQQDFSLKQFEVSEPFEGWYL